MTKILSWTPIHDKNFQKIRNRGRILNYNIYKTPTASIILNDEKLIKDQEKPGCPLSMLLFNLVLKF